MLLRVKILLLAKPSAKIALRIHVFMHQSFCISHDAVDDFQVEIQLQHFYVLTKLCLLSAEVCMSM